MTTVSPTSPTTTSSVSEITNKDGSFVQDGKKVNLSSLMMNLMLQRVQSVDGVLSGMMNQMNENNVTTKNMNNFLEQLRDIRPTSANGKVSAKDMIAAEDKTYAASGNKAWPRRTWGLDLNKNSYTQNQVDQLIETMKSKISTVNSNQQQEQIKLEKYNNVRNESMQMVSTIMKSQSQMLMGIINNMGA